MTSFLSHIAATGGAGASASAGVGPQGGGATPHSGYSSEGSTADFAGKEQRLDNGSAFDGWSEAEDLALMVGEVAPAGAAAAAAISTGAGPDAAQGGSTGRSQQQQQQQPQDKLRVSTAVQTAPGADAEVAPAHLGADVAPSPDSPDSFVITDSPELFDESAATAEYEAVPRQRSSGTQTQAHLLAGAPLRSAAAGGQLRWSGACGAGTAGVGVDSCLADIQAAFGRGAKPAVHTRLGGRHPFGPTHLYAYRGAVFEVLRSGSVATVTLFEA